MKLSRTVLVLLSIQLSIALGFLLLEGISSVLLLVWTVTWQTIARSDIPRAERRYTRYDPELGWVSIPEIRIPDLYGPGIGLTTNAKGFRNRENFTTAVPVQKSRIICSGDSFTLGYGVDDNDTWCELLRSFDKRLQTVNMGQGGYGVDQAYLWYMRDGAKLDHTLHIFAFITVDFYRMQERWSVGYGKPVLSLQDNKLVLQHVPVPKSRFRLWLVRSLPAVFQLRTAELIEGAVRKLYSPEPPDPGANGAFDVALKVFEELEQVNKQSHSTLVLVYLPIDSEYYPVRRVDEFRARLRTALEQRGLFLIDLVPDFRALPPGRIWELFIPEGVMSYSFAAHHYSVKGNEWVAKTLYARLMSNPVIARALEDTR